MMKEKVVRLFIVLLLMWSMIVAAGAFAATEKAEIFPQLGHTDFVKSVAFSSDGRFALSGSDDKTIRLWNANTGVQLLSFSGHTDKVTSVAFSPDGRFVLSGGWDKTLRLWDVSTGKEIRSFSGHTDKVTSVAFSPDGRFALSGSRDRTLRYWDVSSGKEIWSVGGYKSGLSSVTFSPDGRFALSGGSDDKTLRLWDVSTGEEIRSFTGHKSGVTSVAFSPDGRFALSGSNNNVAKTTNFLGTFSDSDKTLRLWDATTGEQLRTFSGHTDEVTSVAFSPDGRFVLSGGWDKTMRLWDVSTGKEIRAFGGHKSGLSSVTFSPDGRFALSGSEDKTLRVWDVSTGKELRSFGGYAEYANSFTYSPDGRFALSGIHDATLRLWEVSTGKEIRTFSGHKSLVNSVAFSPDGRFALSGSNDATLRLWDVSTGKEIRSFSGHKSLVNSVAFSPDGRFALSGSKDATMRLWDVATGKETLSFAGHKNMVTSVAFSPDGRFVLSGSEDKTLRLWDVSTGKEIRSFTEYFSEIWCVAFSPDGRFVLSGGSHDSTLRLWDVSTGKEIRSLAGHTARVTSAAFSPDGSFALSGSQDATTRIWNINTGKELAQFISFSDGEWASLTPDGYFNASPNGAKHINVRIGNKVYFIDNFYEKFFNPVYVASVLQGKKVAAVADIRKGIHTPPDVQIVSPQQNASLNTDTITIKVSAKDTGGGIDEIRLYHNGKAIGEDQRGLKLVSKGGETFKDYNVTLVDGINTFRAVGFSKDRTESNPYELAVKLTAAAKDVSLYVFAVGINKYKNPALNLNYAVPDAKGIVSFFQEKSQLFKKVNIIELYDEEATKEGIIAKLKQLEKSNPQDAVLIYLAGHGDNVKDVWYFIPHELIYPEREDHVQTKSISSVELSGYIRNIKAQKILMLVDACKSGAMLLAFRGFEDRKAIAQLSRSTGMHVVAASTKNQFAAEVKELGHGVFTYTLLEGLGGKAAGGSDTVTVRKLMGYVEEQLPEITKKYKQEAQFPVVDSRGMDFPLVLVK